MSGQIVLNLIKESRKMTRASYGKVLMHVYYKLVSLGLASVDNKDMETKIQL